MLVFTPQKGTRMYRSIRWLVSIVALYSSMLFSADTNHILQFPQDILVNVYNFLPLKDQYKLALMCKSLYAIFNSPAVFARDGSTVRFNKERGLINAIKNYFMPDRKDTQLQCASFCKKIAVNKIGGAVTFYCDNPQQLELFFESLKTNNTITQLNISEYGLSDEGVRILASCVAMQCSSCIKSLILRKNAITYTGVISLLSQLPHLEELDVSENFIGEYVNKTEVNGGIFTHSRIASNEELKPLGSALCTLKKLYMNGCYLYEHQIAWMAEYLKTNTTLEELYLAANDINDDRHIDGRLPLAHAANTENSTLKILDLSDNGTSNQFHYDIKRKDLKVIL